MLTYITSDLDELGNRLQNVSSADFTSCYKYIVQYSIQHIHLLQ